MFYLTIVLGIILVLIAVLKKNSKINQNSALYRFCQIRRNIIKNLKLELENDNLTTDELVEVQRVQTQLNKTIHFFHDLKIDVFNYKHFKNNLCEITNITEKAEHKKFKTDIAKKFQEEYTKAIILAFVDLVPFFKWRLAAWLIVSFSKLLVFVGLTNINSAYQWLAWKLEKHHMERLRFS
jgi:hypothetical protein